VSNNAAMNRMFLAAARRGDRTGVLPNDHERDPVTEVGNLLGLVLKISNDAK
jgi:hypothetical protein